MDDMEALCQEIDESRTEGPWTDGPFIPTVDTDVPF